MTLNLVFVLFWGGFVRSSSGSEYSVDEVCVVSKSDEDSDCRKGKEIREMPSRLKINNGMDFSGTTKRV